MKGQQINLLVVTDQTLMYSSPPTDTPNPGYNLRFTDCEYKFSMQVERYRPDYVIIDCSMGKRRAREFARNISADPRIPFVRIVLVGDPNDFPRECDKEVFASVQRPFTTKVLDELLTQRQLGLMGSKSQNEFERSTAREATKQAH
jgi:DNA-binding NtrC family response regulator